MENGERLHRWTLWVLLCLLPATVWSDIIISQVYEGNSSDRYVEVANTGTSAVDLGAYQLGIWKKRKTSGDGSTDGISPTLAPLSGTLDAGACRVFKNSSANNPGYADAAGTSNGAVDFDGNDAIALVNTSGVVIDLFGVGINNRDQNYSRRPSAKTASIYFNPADWTASVYTVADEATSTSGDYLGAYFFEAAVPALVVSPASISDLSSAFGTASASQSYTLTGSNLTQAVSVSASSTEFQISTNASTGFSSGLTLIPTAGQLLQTIFVRISSSAKGGVVAGSITHLSGSTSVGLPVSGRVLSSESKAGLRAGMQFSVPNSGFVGQPINEVVTVIEDTSGSIATLQGLIDSARVAQPEQFILVRLRANTTYPVAGSPLILSSKMTLSGAGTTLAAGLTTTAGSLVRISPGSTLVSIDRLTLEGAGKNLYGIEGAGVSRVNVDRVTVRDTGLSGIFLQGLGSSVFNNEMTVTRCMVQVASNANGIHLRQATQGVVMENEFFNNRIGILLESADHCLVVNNQVEYNATDGICLQDSKNARIASNLLVGNPIAVATRGASASTSSSHFIFRNEISSATTGISLGQSKDTIYGNSIAAGVATPLTFGSGAVNRVIQIGSSASAPLQEYFYPPTFSNPHTDAVKNGQERADVSTSATTLSEIQAAYNSARVSQPGRVTVLHLTAPIITGDQALVLQGDTCVILKGRINLLPGVAAFQATGTTSAPLGFISISGGTIDGQNTTGRSGMIFTNCSKVLVEGVNLVNFGSKTTRVTGSDVILFAGCKDPCIVDSSTINGGAARGIWTKGITGSSLSGMLFIDNVVSEVNMDGIDFDVATSSSSAFYNLSQNNIRYGVFVEEGAKNVQVVGNTCSGNDIGINVYAYDVGPTEQNTLAANVLSANRRGLRFGAADPEPSQGILTRNNFAFNNRIQNTTTLAGIDAQSDGSENYITQNILSSNSVDIGSTTTALFFNPSSSSSSGVDGAAIANEDFAAGFTSGGLVGQQGWLTYGSNNSSPIAVSDGSVHLLAGLNYQAAYKTITPYQFADNASVHLRIDIQVQSASTAGSDFFLVTRETDSTTGQPIGKNYFRLYVKEAIGGFQIGWNPHAETGTVTPPVPTYADTVFSFGRDYRLVLRCDSVPSRNNDDTYLFVDPAGSASTPLLSRTSWAGNTTDEFSATSSSASGRVPGSLSLVVKQQTTSTAPALSMDVKNIVVGDALSDVGVTEVSQSLPVQVATDFTNSSTIGSVSWTGGPNWSSTPQSSTNTSIRFQGALTGALNISQDTGANFLLHALTNANTGAYAMNFSGGALEFSKNGATGPALVFATGTTTLQTFSNPFVLNETLTVNQSSATVSNSILAGVISGSGGMRKSGNGYVYITGSNNSFGGVVTNSAGILFVSSIGNAGANSSLGTNGMIVMGDGSGTNALRTINLTAETSDKLISLGGSTINTRIENYSGGVLTLNGPINTVTNAGKVLYLIAKSNNMVLGGSIATNTSASNNLSLILTNSTNRMLTLAASNAFRGGLTLESGALRATHPNSLGTGDVRFSPSVANGVILTVAYPGSGPVLGNLLLQNSASLDLGLDSSSAIKFSSGTGWNAGATLMITNSSGGGKLYFVNTNGVVLGQIKSSENTNATASLAVDGLLTFTAPPPVNSKPVVTAAQAFSVSENVPFATTVGTVVATDADANSALSGWAIVSGNTGGVFAINSANGQITVVGALNFEGAAAYALGVTVSDGTETSAVGTVIISVTDVSEYSDFFGNSSATADDNGDGISNLMAYALGATSPSSVVVPPGLNTADPTKLTITALIRINDPKVSVVGEYGLTLGTWETASPIAGVDSSNQAGVVAGVTKWQDFSVLRAPDPKKFLHLKATQSQ